MTTNNLINWIFKKRFPLEQSHIIRFKIVATFKVEINFLDKLIYIKFAWMDKYLHMQDRSNMETTQVPVC